VDEQLIDSCAQWWADRLEISDNDKRRDIFKQALLPRITDNMELFVDYRACLILRDALDEAGVFSHLGGHAIGILPLKTVMRIRDGVVEVSEGYGSAFVSLDDYSPGDRCGIGNLFPSYEQITKRSGK